MKCPNCAMENGDHGKACWREQVLTLFGALVIFMRDTDVCKNFTSQGWNALYNAKVQGANARTLIEKRNDFDGKIAVYRVIKGWKQNRREVVSEHDTFSEAEEAKDKLFDAMGIDAIITLDERPYEGGDGIRSAKPATP